MLLVAWAADINAAILKTQTPLHWAFLYGDLESFNALLMAGPNVVATSIRGNTISLLPYFILLPFVFLMFVEALHCSAKRFDYVDTITGMINGLLPAWANRGAINASGWVILKQYPSLGKYLRIMHIIFEFGYCFIILQTSLMVASSIDARNLLLTS